MESLSHNFNLFTFVIQHIIYITDRLSCVVSCILFGGETNSWNFKSKRIA